MTKNLNQFPVFITESFHPILNSDCTITTPNRIFEVSVRSKQYQILRELNYAKDGLLVKEDLIIGQSDRNSKIDHITSIEISTKRYKSAIKALSRLRLSLEIFFADVMPPGFHWLPWNKKLNGWTLFQHVNMNRNAY